MSSSKGEVEPTGTSRKESGKDSTRRSSNATKGWSNHSRSKWFIDWCCGDASNPTAQPCGPFIFIDDSRRRRVLGAVLRWEDAKGGRRHFYLQKVYGAKGNVVANSKGTLMDLELCEGFRAGVVNTPFYRELILGGGFVLAREFFDMLEDRNIALDVPCDVGPSLELSLPLRLCGGCESSGAAAEGDDLGFGPATHLHRGESGGQFDDSEDEGPAPPLSDTRRSVLSIPGVQTDAPVQRKSTEPAGEVAAFSEVNFEASEGQSVEEVTAGGLGSQGAPQKRRGDRPDEFAGSTKKLKSKAPRTAGEKRKGTEGEQGRQVLKWREFCNVALNMTPHNNLWILADQKGEEAIRKQGAALRSYFPLAMVGENVWKLAVEFFEKWETGRLLEHDGAKWIMRKKKVKNVKPGVAYIDNDNVPVDPPTKKGKKEKEEGEWFVQVPESDAHCWKTMESLTDNEKCRVLKKVIACEVVWVQAGSLALAKLGKLSVQEMVHLVKCDRVLVRLWNYYQFKHDKRPDADWSQRCPFLKSRKYVTDSSLFKDCPPYMGCDDDKSIEATEKLAGHKKLSVDWRNKVLSVLTGSRLKSREIALAEGIVHIKWKKYEPHPAQHATGSSLAGPSTSPASLVSPIAKPAPDTTPMKLLKRLQAQASGHRSLHPRSHIPADHLSWKDANIHFLPKPQSRSTEADWGHDMIWHPGVIQPAIQKGEWIVAVAVPDGGWMPLPRGSKSDFLDVARIAVLQKVRAGNDSFAPGDMSVISTVGRLFAELQDKCWLELTEDYYDLDTSPSKGRVDWKIPPPSGMHVSTGSRGPDGGENEGDEAGGGKGVPPGSQGGSHGDTTTAEGSGGVPGEAFGQRTKRTDTQSWSRAGVASRDPKIDSGAVRDGTAPPVGDCQPLRSERGGTCGGPGDRETAKFAGIRTSSGKGGQPGIVVPAGGAACGGQQGHSSEFDTGSGEVAGLHAREEGRVMDKEKEGEEGDTREELEEGGDEGEEEEDEGEEGEEGEETELSGLLGGKEGEKGELDIGDDERTFGDDDDRSGESSD
ncbi:hypothetical protein CBR_g39906 [Chara braunii]|uniref:Uncharacterized protein n=1 Tax=Chara braunii TaxID=69332 RepID=A0A388K1H3_CHABU|nr:hypothetical protein CBR_g39906 [Chara braunii]|eukprot:GBG63901.1 hypothetical protein CBR_g39906 [Chara braunii]